MPTVVLPRVLAAIVGDVRSLEVSGGDIGSAFDSLFERAPGLRPHIFDEAGKLRPHVAVFVDDEAVRFGDRSAPVDPDATIRIVNAVSGG